jgi:hypothetical protein
MFAIPPAIVQNTSDTAATSAIHATIRADEATTLGICRFVPDATSKEGEFPGYPMGVSNYLSAAVPQKFQGNFRYTDWGLYWVDRTKIKIFQQPQHGELETSDVHNPGDIVYYPKKGYIGQDRVVVLATNTLPDGSPVRAKLIFFLNVIPIADIPLGGGGQYVKSNTKYCPTGKETWTISTAPSGESSYYSQPQGSFPFGSPSMNVTYGDLSGFAVGEEKFFGGAAPSSLTPTPLVTAGSWTRRRPTAPNSCPPPTPPNGSPRSAAPLTAPWICTPEKRGPSQLLTLLSTPAIYLWSYDRKVRKAARKERKAEKKRQRLLRASARGPA